VGTANVSATALRFFFKVTLKRHDLAEELISTVEVADIFRHRGPVWRASHAGHVSLGQLKVMAAIERCRTVALGGHVERCEDCAHLRISYNSCRNRHRRAWRPNGQKRYPAGTSTSTNIRLTEAEIHAVSMACRTAVGSHR
jgi:hypothetical protein